VKSRAGSLVCGQPHGTFSEIYADALKPLRPAQPPVPNRRTVPVIASATMPAVGASDGCSPEANSASHRASFTFGRVT
jgi:hypothetical protein